MPLPVNDTISKVKVQAVKNPILNPNAMCNVILQGETFADATYMSNQPKAHIRKLNKKEYVILSTGEIKDFKEKADNHRQLENLQRTFNNIRWLIRHNFQAEADNQLFVTLTYREAMADRERLYTDFKKFFQRLQRARSSHKLDYLIVCEPTGKGTWHIHMMLKSDKPVLIVANDEMSTLWQQGFTKTKRLKSDDVGTYYTAYFTDLIPEELDNEETSDKKKSKAREKGARLRFYPPNFKFYRRSKGIIDPVHTQATIEQLTAYFGSPMYATEYTIEKEIQSEEEEEIRTNVLNKITKAYYKKKPQTDV